MRKKIVHQFGELHTRRAGQKRQTLYLVIVDSEYRMKITTINYFKSQLKALNYNQQKHHDLVSLMVI